MSRASVDFGRGPLADLRVIELGSLIAGPFCGQLLGDLGAQVIKVEPPGQGDPMREWGREKAMAIPCGGRWSGETRVPSPSICVKARVSTAARLVGKADIVLENFRPGTMEKWGCGYPASPPSIRV